MHEKENDLTPVSVIPNRTPFKLDSSIACLDKSKVSKSFMFLGALSDSFIFCTTHVLFVSKG